MSCLIRINKKGDAIIVPEAMKLAPELSYLTPEEGLCIIHAYDYESLFRQFPEIERKRRALAKVFGVEREKFFEEPKIKKSIQFYRELQFNAIREQIIILERKLISINIQLDKLDDNDNKGLKDLLANSKEIKKAIDELNVSLNKEEEEENEEDQRNKISFLERLQRNKEKYNAIKNTGKKQWNLPF